MQYFEYREQRAHGTGQFPFAYYRVDKTHPRYHMMDHWHDEYELLRVLEGTLTLKVDGCPYTGVAGDMFWLPGGAIHSAEPHRCVYECVVFDLDAVFTHQTVCRAELRPVLRGEVRICCHWPGGGAALQPLATALNGAAERGSRLMAVGGLYQLLATAFQQGLYKEVTAGPGQRESQRLAWFRAVLELVRSRYGERLTLGDMAACAHMNERYFCRVFKQMTGKSPMVYLNHYRVECACEQLAYSGKSVTEVAMDCGFDNVSYFIRVFRKHTGQTPGRYAAGRGKAPAHGN